FVDLAEREAGDSDRHVGPFLRCRSPLAAGLDLFLAVRGDGRLFRELGARAGQIDLDAFLGVKLRDLQRLGIDDDVVIDTGRVNGELAVRLLLDLPAHARIIARSRIADRFAARAAVPT